MQCLAILFNKISFFEKISNGINTLLIKKGFFNKNKTSHLIDKTNTPQYMA
jgi:hypothetical protein